MNVLLFQIYGNQRAYHLELTYSILSAARFLRDDPADIRIVLAADEENHRPDLPVEHLHLSPEMLREWQMGGSYNHAIQAYALGHAVRTFDAPVILIDSDTIIHDHPKRMFERIAPGKALMHAREGRLGDSIEWPEWKSLIRQSEGSVAGWPVTADTVMYNAGVLGLHPQDAPLVEDVKAAMRAIRANSGMFTAVQLAASLVLDARTQLSTCDDMVEHYWGGPRAYYHYQIAKMFPGIMNGTGVESPSSALPVLERSLTPAFRHRLAARIKRIQRARGPEFATAYSAYLSALSLHRSDPALANVWGTTALNMLQWGMGGQSVQPRDFLRFTPAHIGTQQWMEPGLRKRWLDYWSKVATKTQ